MAALGPCSLHGSQYTLDPNSFISINEVTTVASVYALAAFMGGDATHVGTSSTNAIGLANSFLVVNNLVNTTTGAALAVTPGGNGTAPQATLNTLANIVASCVNSDGTGSVCSALAAAATPSGGTAPTDTIQGILNVARNPANNVSALFALASPTPPFQPTLSAAPNDWILAVTYTMGGSFPSQIALDASGNAWMTSTSINGAPYSVTELNSNGAILSGANGYSIGNLAPSGIAIDPTGNVWVSGTGAVVKLSSNGTLLSGTNGFTGGGLTTPFGIALDGQGNAWVSDSGSKTLIKLDSSGNILSGASGFTTGSTFLPMGVAIDRSGDAWVVDGSNLTEFNNSGAVLSGSGYPTGFTSSLVAFDGTGNAWVSAAVCCTAGFPELGLTNVAKVSSSGMQISPALGYPNCTSFNQPPPGDSATLCIGWNPNPVALDGAGNVWGVAVWENLIRGRANSISSAISELSNAGTILSGNNGLTGGANWTLNFSNGGSSPGFLAIDGGGNVWVISGGGVLEFIGAATPVVTPFSVGVKNGTLGARP
jgi:streptogramin lyase